MEGRAVIDEQPPHDVFRRAAASAGAVSSFQDTDVDARLREPDGSRKAIRPTAHHHRGTHPLIVAAAYAASRLALVVPESAARCTRLGGPVSGPSSASDQ